MRRRRKNIYCKVMSWSGKLDYEVMMPRISYVNTCMIVRCASGEGWPKKTTRMIFAPGIGIIKKS